MSTTSIQSAQPASPAGQSRPLAATIAAVVTAIHTYRVIALSLTAAALSGEVPLVFVLGGVGDFLIGITAPLVLFALWRKVGLGIWTMAIAWHALAIADFMMGQGLIAFVETPVARLSPLSPALHLLTTALFILITNVAPLVLLMRRNTRSYYLYPLSNEYAAWHSS